ncbi:Aminopeptidase 2 [Caloramator mitchellensis]|uniref:Aminopeptidase 2 n=1 Tax=Caloramator mitchellensis TaxID=908809 RepID=A0A0R3K2F3_CALMK|nr:aminopeptidase [Caloramator mitchellensis]KRQ86479.1 Aminopeptidase 2 [Caloramator mitchellensis]
MDSRITKLADVLLNYSLNIKKGEKLLIQGGEATLPLVKAVYKRALELGAHPQVDIVVEDLGEYMLKFGSDEQIMYVPESTIKAFESVDAFLTIWGDVNTRFLTNVDPAKLKLRSRGRQELVKIISERMEKKELKWCGTQFPTHANAQEASMSLTEYEDFVYGAGYIDDENPVAKWEKIREEQDRICEYLNNKENLRIVSKDTDISMSIKGRKWINCAGEENFPDGEVFTCPVEDSVNGYIRFSFPGIYAGREIEDIRLEFENGRVVKATAAKGEELLKELLETDEGAKLLGEVAIGTNYGIQAFTKNMLFDEKIGGTVHLAIGRAFPEAGGKNMSTIHWDMLCDMKEEGKIYADGELIYEKGKFLI